jgi:hypothetical protein
MVACSRVVVALEKTYDAGYSYAVCERAELGFSRPDKTSFELVRLTLVIESARSNRKEKNIARVNDKPLAVLS